MTLLAGVGWGQDLSSGAFVGALGLINADGNMTSWNLIHDPAHSHEGNPIARPFMSAGEGHYVYDAGAIWTCIAIREQLKVVDKSLGFQEFGTKDVFTLGLYALEWNAIRSWQYEKDDVMGEVLVSEAEFFITSSVLNLKF
jgi:hypothetical protein